MDNLTIVVPVRNRKINAFMPTVFLPNGKKKPAPDRQRKKIKEPSGGNIRVQWVKLGTSDEGLKIEGSFPLFLQGQNVLCSTDIRAIVPAVVYRVLHLMGIEPTREERRRIDEGRIKIDRVDVVGWLRTSRLSTSVGMVIEALNYGLKASRRPCMYFPRETLVWNVTNRNWSLMFYDKKAQLLAKQEAARKRDRKTGDDPEVNIWDDLHSGIKEVAESHLRVELRVLRAQLRLLEIEEVRQLDQAMLEKWVQARVDEVLNDLRSPLTPIPVTGKKITSGLAIGLLRQLGVDLTAGMGARSRQRMESVLRKGFQIERINQAGLAPEYVRFVTDLKKPRRTRLRFGVPTALRRHVFTAKQAAT